MNIESGVLKKRVLSAAISLAAVSSLSAGVAHAEGLVLEEVIVTAQKRAESAQDVPVAVTAMQGDDLAKQGIQSFSDLTKVSPSLTITHGAQKNNSPIALRGIGTRAFSMSVEPSVAVIVDDVPVARAAQAFSNLVDIERVEVLRGPQSTLFGKSASAGVINITTKAPSEELEGSVEYTKIIDDEDRVTASISGALTDTVGVRASAYYSDVEGNIDNLTDGSKLNGGINKGGRVKLSWDATDDLLVTMIGEYNESDENCCASPYSYVADGSALLGLIPSSFWLDGLSPSDDNTDVRYDTTPESLARDWSGTLKLDYSIGEYTVTSITGYRDWGYQFLQEMDLTDIDLADLMFPVPAGLPILEQTSDESTKLLTQEIRVTSPVFDNFEYVAGLYYSKVENEKVFRRAGSNPTFFSDWDAEAENESYAIFGQGKYALSEQWSLIAGLRYNVEEITLGSYDRRDNPLSAPDESYTASKESDTDEVVTGKLALQYFADEDLMFFGSYSRGYKGQAYDVTSSFNPETLANPVAPETSNAFELGVKSTLLDGRMQLNATLFHTEYKDFQAQSQVDVPGVGTVQQLNNVGTLETAGLEVDAVFLVSENFRVTLGAAYIDATIKSFEEADCYALQTPSEGCVGGAQDLSGEDLNNSPDFKFNIAGSYVLPLEDLPFDGFMDFSYQWQDDVHFDLLNDPNRTQDAYGIFNLSLGVDSKDEDYRVTLFANNLFDQDYLGGITSAQAIYGGSDVRAHVIPRGAERQVGLRVNMDF